MSALTFRNNTAYIAQYVVHKGDQVLARLPGIAPGAQLSVPLAETFDVIASTILHGNTYTSAPITMAGAAHFLAQVKEMEAQGTYEFEVLATPSTVSNQMQFEKTSIAPVTFNISRSGVYLQSVVVQDSFEREILEINDVYAVFAVINGITTQTLTTTNPNAVFTAVADTSDTEFGYFTLAVS